MHDISSTGLGKWQDYDVIFQGGSWSVGGGGGKLPPP